MHTTIVTITDNTGHEFTTQVPTGRIEDVCHVYRNNAGNTVAEHTEMFLPWTSAELLDLALASLPSDFGSIVNVSYERR